ncbi:trans-Golgi network-localized SYP41-interacting protein 1 isoform X2 [Gossypium raimondii]|uniref:trans-Golgi network-localized SYP41-interacting protein 1 isoform X2 n=1 Tax=Gossypium raimondii TaxID=29730 RepID=UPI00227C880D|nr:trans-Golgi network-localized SYP41-interacting protein 1 isoform X2 [Gossypium raimondii]
MSEINDSEDSGARNQSSTYQEAESIEISHVDSKEDMFMDASDELNNDNKEAVWSTDRDNNAISDEKPDAVPKQFDEVDNGAYNNEDNDNNHVVKEMERLRALLEQAAEEKGKLESKYKEEMETLSREIYVKDKEIEGLTAKLMSSVAETEKDVKNQQYEVALERISAALGSVIDQGDLLGDSGVEQIVLVEKSTLALIEKYNQFLSEVNQLRQCLTKAESDFGVQEFGTVFVAAHDELHELRRKEAQLVENIAFLEDENRKFFEQVESEKAMVEMLKSELEKTKTEVEQEKMRCANTKEKLSMAVTKGKALVQQRDALKQSLADKTSELEKCLAELQEKSSALEAAELHKEELVKNEVLVVSLQESLSEKTLIIEAFEHILSQIDVPEELQSVDIVGRARWLANERKELKSVSMDFYRLKDTICAIDLPENVSFPDLDSRLAWLKESFYHAKDDINMLQNEISRTKEAARDEVDHLSASLSTVQQEKHYIKEELDHLRNEYEEIVGKARQISLDKDHLSASLEAELVEKDYIKKELDNLSTEYENVVEKIHRLSSEKNQMISMLVEASGMMLADQEGVEEASYLPMLIDRCFRKIKDQPNASSETTFVEAQLFEKLQSLFYVRDLELTLCEEVLEEDLLVRSQLNGLSNQLKVTSEELFALKEEKDVLQKALEQSEEKSSLLREKLSMAVKKGKGLVQDRENLKLLLEEKNSEIEKLRLELQHEESTVANCRDQISTLSTDLERIPLLESDLAAMKEAFDHILSQIDVPEELQSMDIVGRAGWLAKERKELGNVSMDFCRLKDTICAIDLPENVSFPDLDSRLAWLKESFFQAKDDINMLQNEISRIKEAARDEIDHLSASLSTVQQEKHYIKDELDQLKNEYEEIVGMAHQISSNKDHLSASLATELVEKDYVRRELDNLSTEYENVVEKFHQLSSEKDQMISMLIEDSGMMMADQEGIEESSYLPMLIDRCFRKIKDQPNASSETTFVEAQLFEKLQSLFYVRDLELTLCEEVLEEDMLVRSQLNDLSDQMRVTSKELFVLKEEKDVLQKDLERSEEKSSLLREKLSMAVKKGKGLVQDRENLKLLLEEKNSEIEKLKLELQHEESTVANCRDQISTLSTDLERIPKLESDLAAMREGRDQLEKFLFESNSILQRLVESIGHIVIPADSTFQEPVEKLNFLSGYMDDCLTAKAQTEQDLLQVKEEAKNVAVKLAEAEANMKTLEDALAVAKNDLSQLAEEKRDVEFGKKNLEIELQKALEEAHSENSKFAEICEARKSLEEALSLAENKISFLISEQQEVQSSRAASETEMEKLREEGAIQSSRLTEAYNTINTLESALSQAEMTDASLTEHSNNSKVEITNLENELRKLKDETEIQARELAVAEITIKSLEDALVKAENEFSELQSEKRAADQEISTLNSKLTVCMEELAGSRGCSASKSIELIGHLNNLQMLAKDQSLLSTMKQCFDRNLEHLKDVDLALKNTREHLLDKRSEQLQDYPLMEDIALLAGCFSDDIDNNVNIGMENDYENAINGDDVSSCVIRVAEGFQLRNKIFADRFEGFSKFLDESIGSLLKKLHATEDEVKSMVENMESLKQNVKNLEMREQEKEKAMAILQDDVETLFSACRDAVGDLHFEVKSTLTEFNSLPGLENLNHGLHPGGEFVGRDMAQQDIGGNRYIQTAEKLLAATREVQSLVKFYETTNKAVATIVHNLQKDLEDTRRASEKAIEERDVCQSRVFKLESDVEALEESYREVTHKVDDYQAKEDIWKEKEAELLSLYNNMSMKEKEAKDPLLSATQLRTLLDKLSVIEIPLVESEDLEPHSSTEVKKLFSIINSFAELQNQINLLSYEKEELQSMLSQQSFEIEHLKEEIERHVRNKPELEVMKMELSEATFGLEKIIVGLGGKELIGNPISVGMRALLPVLEKQVNALLLEAESSKSRAQELGTKLLGSQNAVDELSTKVKLLEDSLQGRTIQAEVVQDRSIFEAPSASTGSEISEIEDAGSHVKKTVSPVPSAAHVRIMQKGSADHLALNIDSETDRLINSEETDEDKGRMFKPLNTTGLIPKQGKSIADRVDGIWVSGGRVLSSRPRVRLGLIAYCLLLHIWLLGTIV